MQQVLAAYFYINSRTMQNRENCVAMIVNCDKTWSYTMRGLGLRWIYTVKARNREMSCKITMGHTIFEIYKKFNY